MFNALFESKGLKRALGILLLIAGNLTDAIPVLAPYKAALDTLGAIFGVVGVGHALSK